jgi:RNA polymerase sigma factor (sigma-70 family)
MTAIMNPLHSTSLATRPSLLARLKSGDDPQSWREFYKTYGGLIRFFAEKAGLTPDEAEEVLQETAIGVARPLPYFTYDPRVCRFKTWLLNLVRWRIQDQLRKRRSPAGRLATAQQSPNKVDDTASTATIERILDPDVPEFGAEWDAAWEKNLFAHALERVRSRIDERQFQIFDLYAVKGWSATEVAQTLRITVARVYLIKHRLSALLKQEARALEREVSR